MAEKTQDLVLFGATAFSERPAAGHPTLPSGSLRAGLAFNPVGED